MKAKKLKIFVILCMMLLLAGCGNSSPDEKAENTAYGKCTILVECSTIFDNMDKLDTQLKDYIPQSGMILEKKTVDIQKGDSVYDVLDRTLKEENILMEASFTGNKAYIEGIDNIYEFSCGELSGWMYCVNQEYPSVGCSDYKVTDGDQIEWHYTCDLGEDVK